MPKIDLINSVMQHKNVQVRQHKSVTRFRQGLARTGFSGCAEIRLWPRNNRVYCLSEHTSVIDC